MNRSRPKPPFEKAIQPPFKESPANKTFVEKTSRQVLQYFFVEFPHFIP
jgi:hypothetical protein